MFTLKIRWSRTITRRARPSDGPGDVTTIDPLGVEHIDNEVDHADHFIPADRVAVFAPDPDMSSWGAGEYHDMRSVLERHDPAGGDPDIEHLDGARLVEVWHNGEHAWYLVTQAWLLGPTGDTIQRLAP